MLLFVLVCAFVRAIAIEVSVDKSDKSIVFHKCCPDNHSLKKVLETDLSSDGHYECVDHEDIANIYNISISPLLVAKSVAVIFGMPEKCHELQIIQTTEAEIETVASSNLCYDRLAIEIINSTVKENIPKTVALMCNISEEAEKITKPKLKIDHIRKCCPRGQAYDDEYHICRDIETESSEKWLMKSLNISGKYIYEFEIGLHCKSDEYAIELNEEMFLLTVEGSTLNVLSRNLEQIGQISPGEWCMDRQYRGSRLVARICSRDCSSYGAFCIRKCCPVGEHYRPRSCGTYASTCVPNTDEVFFNISSYLDPLRKDIGHFGESLGFRSDIRCPAGKYVLNRMLKTDWHELTKEGLLKSPGNIISSDYCLEAFDRRRCGNDVAVAAVLCYIDSPQIKDFSVAFVVNSISSVCLALTLVVYCSLPELRNLHGRTLICHVSMMLLAFSCLARVQYGIVYDNRICTMLAYGIYFGFVAAFAWLNVMCFDIWWTFGSMRTVQPLRKANAERRRFAWYSLYAWSVAVLLTLTMLLLDLYPVADFLDADMGKNMCWFGTVQNTVTDWPHYVFFVVPMGLVICTNFVLWVLTARHCARVKSEVHRLQAGSVGDRAKQRFRGDRAKYILTGKLWVVMGAGWVAELMSTLASEPQWLWTVTDLLNELQGVFIFLILVFKPKVYYLIKRRLGLEKPDGQKNSNSSSGRTSTTFLSRTISSDERNNLRTSLPNNLKQS